MGWGRETRRKCPFDGPISATGCSQEASQIARPIAGGDAATLREGEVPDVGFFAFVVIVFGLMLLIAVAGSGRPVSGAPLPGYGGRVPIILAVVFTVLFVIATLLFTRCMIVRLL